MRKGYNSIAGWEKLTTDEIRRRNMETYGDKVKKYRVQAKLTAEQLATKLGIGESSVRNWECGISRPDPEYLYRMFTILDVEPNEFFGIRGIGTLMTNKERDLLDSFRALDETGKEDLMTIAQAMGTKAYHRKLKTAYERIKRVPTWGRLVAAGDGADWEEHPEEETVTLYNVSSVADADEICIVNGKSMEPQFQDGDLVLVEHCQELKNGDIGIFYVPGHGGVIKQVAYDRLHSLNPEYDDIFPYEDGAQVIGRVLGRVTKDMRPSIDEINLFMEACQAIEAAE